MFKKIFHTEKIFFFFGLILIVGGISLRFYNLRYNTEFDWDQENSVAFPAVNIITKHEYPLIGAKTSAANLYIGPLYSYIAAFAFAVFNMDPLSGANLAVFVSVLTLIIAAFLTKKMFGNYTAFYLSLFWSTSPTIIAYDRIPWNVNLLPISVVFICWGLFNLLNSGKYGWLLLAFGIFFGLNSHYSILLVVFGIIITSFINRRILSRSVVWPILFFFIALLPLFIFNLRHQSILSQNLGGFYSQSRLNFAAMPLQFLEIIKRLLENQGSLILIDSTTQLKVVFALFFFIALFLLKKHKHIKNYVLILFSLMLAFAIGFSFYKGPIPDYYFIPILPLTLLGFALVSEHTQRFYKLSILFILLICATNLFIAYKKANAVNSQALGVKQEIVATIKNDSGGKDVAVVFDMDSGRTFGYNYLFDYYHINIIPREKTSTIYWISYPAKRFPAKPFTVFGDIALGTPQETAYILKTKGILFFGKLFSLRIPQNWATIQCQMQDYDKYFLSPNQNVSCSTLGTQIEGILIENIPNCDESYIRKIYEQKGKDYTGLYEHRYPVVKILEENRCVVFSDYSSSREKNESKIFKDILDSLKLNP